MAQIIKIKRSTNTASPTSLNAGELAYSDNSDKLFIGAPADNAVIAIGGKLYVDMLDHTAGTLTASSAVIVDANSKIDKVLTGDIRINNTARQIDTSAGDLILNPTANLDIDTGTIDLSTQATEFKLIDNSATAGTFATADHTYLTFDTTNSAELVKFGRQVEFSGAYTLPTSDGTNGQALLTDGSGTVTFGDVATFLTVDGINGATETTANVGLLTDDLRFSAGEGIDISVSKSGTDVTVSVAAEDATSSNKGVASFDSTDFSVSSGAVSVQAITLGSTGLNPGETTASIAGLTTLGFGTNNISITGATISSAGNNADITLSPHGTGTVKVPSGYKDRSGFTTDSLVTKEYVDALKQALDIKDSARLATTANLAATYNNADGTLTNSGSNAALSIDDVTTVAGDRILVKNQTNGEENGIYTVTTVGDGSTAWVLTRATDANVAAEITGGTFVFVEEGTAGADNGYVFTHNGTPTLGTTDLTVTQFSGAGQIVAGDALSKDANTLHVNDDNITLEVSSDNLGIKGISATAAGDILLGAASDGGYTRHVKPSSSATAYSYILSMDTSGAARWADTLDGGTF